jgi:DNA repair protein RAD16
LTASLRALQAQDLPVCIFLAFEDTTVRSNPFAPIVPSTINYLTNFETATRRSARFDSSSLAQFNTKSGSSTVNGDDASSSDFPELSKLVAHMSAKKEKASKGRDSLSSVATSHDYNEDSGYSTPATSAAATPAEKPKPSARRGRRPTAMATAESSTLAANVIARAAALRNSEFSLNSATKRKRVILDSEDEDEDNTADAQLARALQEQEDAAGLSMDMDLDTGSSTLRRTQRKAQKILPKTDFASDFDEIDEETFASTAFSPRLAKRPKVELFSSGKNTVKFSSKTTKDTYVIMDSDDSDDFVEIDDSDADSDAPIAMSTPRSRMKLAQTAQIKSSPSSKFKEPVLPSSSARSGSKMASSAKFPKAGPSTLKREDTKASTSSSALTPFISEDSDFDSDPASSDFDSDASDASDVAVAGPPGAAPPRLSRAAARRRLNLLEDRHDRRGKMERARLEAHHPELHTMWKDLENLPKIGDVTIEQPKNINRELKPFQLQGVAWMKAMEKTEWGGGLLGDEMGMGKTIQAVSLIMSDWPAAQPSLVLIPPVALMQWQQEIAVYTDGTLRTFVFHGTNAQTKGVTVKELKKYDVILMSYNSLESMYRKQEKGFKRKNGMHKEQSIIHQIHFHRVILDEAHNIKVRSVFLSS